MRRCRSRQSPALFGDEVADRGARADSRSAPPLLVLCCGRDQPCAHKSIDDPRLIKWHQARNSFAVIGDGDLVAVSHDAEVSAEVVSEFSDACFHLRIMAPFDAGI